MPNCIKYHPGVVLEVILSPSDVGASATATQRSVITRSSTEDNAVANRQITQTHATTPSGDNIGTLSRASTFRSLSPLSNINTESKATTLSFEQVMQLAQTKSIGSKVEQRIVSSLPSDVQVQVRASTNLRNTLIQLVKDGLVHQPNEQLAECLQELNDKVIENNELASRIIDLVCKNNELASKNNDMSSRIMDLVTENNRLASENNKLASRNNDMASENNELTAQVVKLQVAINAKQDEMKNLQIQALDRLTLLQHSVKALLTQTYELHEYSIPRLFIVLPKDGSSWNPLDLLSNKFRLYFLCECGEHTKATNSKIPHHIHLAKHEGYDITRPNELFQKYGPYVLTILRMLKFGISVAGVAVPAVSLLLRDDSIAKATSSLKMLLGNLQSGMDQAIGYIEKISPDEINAGNGPLEQIGNNEALEGADLRQLESFLKSNDENRVLGNLYRTVTAEGHVKWVCIDHYREKYHDKKAVKAFYNAVGLLRGDFDENTGRVNVKLVTRLQAEQFYTSLEKARSVYELRLELDWETTYSDLKMLRDTLALTNVGVLELHLKDVPTRGILSRNLPYDPILDIMRHRSIQSFTIRGLQDFSRRSSLLSRNYDFSNLRHLNISLNQLKDDIPGVKHLVTKAPSLSSLAVGTDTLGKNNGHIMQAYQSLAEHRTYPVNFKEWDICIPPPPPRESDHSVTAQQGMEQLLQIYCDSTSELELHMNTMKWFGNTVESLIGWFDEDRGRVEVALLSRVQAEQFYFALGKAKSLTELKVELHWETTHGDLKKLRDTLSKFNVSALEFHLKEQDHSTKDTLSYNLHDPLLDIMQQPSIQSFAIRGLSCFSERSGLQSGDYNFSNLRHLNISPQQLKDDIAGIAVLIAKASNLSTLMLGTGSPPDELGHALQLYKAIAKHQTYLITLEEWDLTIPLPVDPNQPTPVQLFMEHLIGIYFDENISRVEMRLLWREHAALLYFVLKRAKSVHELKLELDWETTPSDFEKLRDTLMITKVGVLELCLNHQDGRTKDIQNQDYDSILDILQHPSIQTFTIRGSFDFTNRSSLLSRSYDFPDLQHLDISIDQLKNDAQGVKCLLANTSKLLSLVLRTEALGGDSGYILQFYNEIAAHRTYSIDFKGLNFRIPPPPLWQNQATIAHQRMKSFLKVHCKCTGQNLSVNSLDRITVEALAEATTDGLGFKELYLSLEDRQSESWITDVSKIVARSKWRKLTLYTRKDEGRVRILESIPWEHLRHLEIFMKPWTFETSVMKALVDSMKKMSGQVGLEECQIWSETDAPLSATSQLGDLLSAFVASTALVRLDLKVAITLEHTLSLFRSADFSRLNKIQLWAQGLNSVQVDAILDALGCPTKLESLRLLRANITDEQKRRMKENGINLSNE